MNKLTVIKSVRFSGKQAESLIKLEQHDVKVCKFIREAVKEKIQRDWKTIKEKKERIFCPF